MNIGKFTQPSEELFELINPADIHLAVTIFEKDLAKLSIGQKLYAYTNSQPDIKHECEIILIGKNLTSEEFAKYINSLQISGYSNIAFTIGGASGHSPELLAKSNYVIALGKMTMSHKLAKVVLIEQLYRAQTIISGHPYHK